MSRSRVPVVTDAALASISTVDCSWILSDDDGGIEVFECASDFGHHQMAGCDSEITVQWGRCARSRERDGPAIDDANG